ncbi:MAG: redoxin domain-containing protein [Candidatus Symbiothrix sp.]|jgi:thiol-disulfide isomerase/thioredoxin|nr:redoxin domain-containing protein [Candidatus Symbiothrix sp.]
MKHGIYALCLILAVATSCQKKVNYLEVAQESEATFNAFDEKLTALQEKGEEITPEMEKEYYALFDQTKADYAQYFEKNINDTTAQRLFGETKWVRRLNVDQLQAILGKAGPEFKATELYQKTAERVDNILSSTPGHPFKEIVAENPKGQEVKLSDYAGKGKYVLLDFWASWCPPCRADMPQVVELYNKYKDKNFEIVGYSLDTNAADWKKGLADLNMTWPQLSSCQGWDSPGAKTYAVNSIPCTLLIDPQGNIIEREVDGNLRGDALAAKLATLIK